MEYRAKNKKSSDYTLKEIAKRFEHREIYLGASSAYLWIGKGADIEWVSKMLDKKLKEKLKYHIARTDKMIKRAKQLIPQLYAEKKMIESCMPATGKKKRYTELKLKISDSEKKLESASKANANYKDYLKHYTPLIKRKVKDIYSRHPVDNVETLGLAVIVEGKEEGTYWTKSELLAGNWLTD